MGDVFSINASYYCKFLQNMALAYMKGKRYIRGGWKDWKSYNLWDGLPRERTCVGVCCV